MALTEYQKPNFRPAKMAVIDRAVTICEEYAEQGMTLTLRQLFYQFVARGWIDNKQTEYKRLGDICQDARMSGLMDWNHLIDRTRNLQTYNLYEGPEDAIAKAAERYNRDVWAPQHQRIEVWIEKDAAIGVIEGVCRENNVPFFSCRGYTSVSEMHQAAQRVRWHMEKGSKVTILHIGDHDPSGLDMSRDIEDRLRLFIHRDWWGLHPDDFTREPLPPLDPNASHSEARLQEILEEMQSTLAQLAGHQPRTRGDFYRAMRNRMRTKGSQIGDNEKPWQVKRIALNMDQIEEYQPPPNPVKKTDGRWQAYAEEYDTESSWELDALDPAVLSDLVDEEINAIRDEPKWLDAQERLEEERQALKDVSTWWESVSATVAREKAKK